MTVGGIAVAGVVARALVKEAQETNRRRTTPLSFDDGVTRSDFAEMVRDLAARTPRVADVAVSGMTATLSVRSNTGLSTWRAEIDFNDYGHLTGKYWLRSENQDSPIPEHYADLLSSEIQSRLNVMGVEELQTYSEPVVPRDPMMSQDGQFYWDGERYSPVPAGHAWDGFRWVRAGS